MMIDLSTIQTLELIQNLQNAKSKDCLYGLVNQTLTPMGARLLQSNVLQPLTHAPDLELRYDALEELATKEDVFFAVRQGHYPCTISSDGLSILIAGVALKAFIDVDRVLTQMTVIPTKPSIQYWEQSINNVILLKQYIKSISPVFDALVGVKSRLLQGISSVSPAKRRLLVRPMTDVAEVVCAAQNSRLRDGDRRNHQ